MSKLSSDSDNPMTCGFVCENPSDCTNRGHFGGLRQKLGNGRVLNVAGDFENSPQTKKSPARHGIHPGARGLLVSVAD